MDYAEYVVSMFHLRSNRCSTVLLIEELWDLPVNEQRRHACLIDKSVRLLKLRLGEAQRSNRGAREAGSDNSCEYPGTATDPHLDHDQSEKCVHRVGTDVHSIRNLFVGKALQQ